LLDSPERKSSHRQWIGKVIMHIDLNSFFPSCEELRDPTLKGKPHAVIMTDQSRDNITKGAVASCSYEARKYGIRSAISLFTAKQLCPHLILNPYLLSTGIRESYGFDRRIRRRIRAR
jgi:nucleotidyltransferase/DNA polymerase involved in DNA repair